MKHPITIQRILKSDKYLLTMTRGCYLEESFILSKSELIAWLKKRLKK